MGALAGKLVEIRRAQPGLRMQEAERIVAVIVAEDKDNVARLFGGRCGKRTGRQTNPGGRLKEGTSRTALHDGLKGIVQPPEHPRICTKPPATRGRFVQN